ncbi:hypothetical protein RFI_25367 [Reticulomyxa filosa]|uniref:Apicomplexan-conserved protein n=1 Tax=Reticulomyxa filosa TaxID=46433 RepID=X6MDQ4_RETFI|nr:hypothetical protein RFI_25367 [Reticulomyxa filosa]|eukprot:ETO12009.1 hypothetical protein RFI_25367 [Reticulomyxa filosa]
MKACSDSGAKNKFALKRYVPILGDESFYNVRAWPSGEGKKKFEHQKTKNPTALVAIGENFLQQMSSLPSNFPSLQRNGSSDSDQSFLFLSSPFNDKKRIIILDWDDTFLPTSYLLSNPTLLRTPYHELSADLRASLGALEAIVLDLILKLIKLDNCHCYIVSNAMNNWILFSCQTYFPTLFSQVFQHVGHNESTVTQTMNIDRKPAGLMYGENSSLMIYSACELFARQCPNQRGLWKLFTFTYIADSKLLISEKERQSQPTGAQDGQTTRENNFKNRSNFNAKKPGASQQLKWLKPETPRREHSKSKSCSTSQSKSVTFSASDTVSTQEDESERRQADFEDEIEETTITINDEEYDGDNVLPPLFERGLEDEIDRFESEQVLLLLFFIYTYNSKKKFFLQLDGETERGIFFVVYFGNFEQQKTVCCWTQCLKKVNGSWCRLMPRIASVIGMTGQLRLLQDSLSKLLACEYSIFVDNFEALLSEE